VPPAELRARLTRAGSVLVVGLVLMSIAAPVLDEVFCDAFHAVLGGHEFGAGGRVVLAPAARVARAGVEQGSSWTVALTLRVDGVREAQSLLLNPRRMLWLPWLVALTAIAGLARGPARVLRESLLASVLVAGWALACVWLTAAWVFASVPGLVYTLDPALHAALHTTYGALVGPPSARYWVGLIVALAVHALEQVRARRAAASVQGARAYPM
jgi:hypothetical protein